MSIEITTGEVGHHHENYSLLCIYEVAPGLSEIYGQDGPGVCLGDGQTGSYLKDMGMMGLAAA